MLEKTGYDNYKMLLLYFGNSWKFYKMLEFLLNKAKEENKKVDAELKKVVLKDSKFPQSTVIIYKLEDEQPVCKVIFPKDNQ